MLERHVGSLGRRDPLVRMRLLHMTRFQPELSIRHLQSLTPQYRPVSRPAGIRQDTDGVARFASPEHSRASRMMLHQPTLDELTMRNVRCCCRCCGLTGIAAHDRSICLRADSRRSTSGRGGLPPMPSFKRYHHFSVCLSPVSRVTPPSIHSHCYHQHHACRWASTTPLL